MKPEIVNLKEHPMDELKYAYCICECTIYSEAVRIRRGKESKFETFNCPRCRTSLGIHVMGTEDPNFERCYGDLIRRKQNAANGI